jgi:hypothetical protein
MNITPRISDDDKLPTAREVADYLRDVLAGMASMARDIGLENTSAALELARREAEREASELEVSR